MLQVNIVRVLIFVICIHTSTIPIAMTLTPDTDETNVNNDIIPTTVDKKTNVLVNSSANKITCPDFCECSENESGQSITASCTKMFNGSYLGLNIVHFILKTSDNFTLGPHEFHAPGLDYPESIAITNQPNTFDPTEIDGSRSCISKTPNYRGRLNIHPDIFQNNSHLSRLTIYHYEHFMDDCNTSTNYLFDAQTLTKFILSVSDYKCWSSLSFSKMPNLEYLYLQDPSFTIIPGIFRPLRNLVELEMRQISNLNILLDTFDGIDLKKLTLACSVVESLANIQITRLQYLRLEKNSMKHINDNDFVGLPGLETLVITDAIETIHEDAFTHLLHLEYLDIQSSNIVMFTEYHLRNNFRLDTLMMANNKKMKYLPVFKLNDIRQSYSIFIFGCCDCGLRTIRDGTFDTMPKLAQLDLSQNGLKKLPRGLFKKLSSLEILNLSKNLIAEIPDDMFEGAIALEQLDLAQNPLTTLKMSPFLRTPKISVLVLTECQIKTWSTSTLPLNSLQFLSIYNNELKHITVDQLKTVPNLKKLKALDNPIQCDDILQASIDWATSHHIETQFYVSIYSFCSPDGDNKTCWPDFQKIVCNPNFISELEFMKKTVWKEYREYASIYNDELFKNANTSSNALLTDMPEHASSDQSPHSTNDPNTETKSVNDVLKLKPNKSAREATSFLVIIVTIVVTTIIT